MKDFLGQEYGPGDLVIYGASGSRCINMVIGRVESITDKYYDNYAMGATFTWKPVKPGMELPEKIQRKTSVKVQPLRASRWEQHRQRTYYTDSRTGKRIDPDASSGKHILKESHYVFADGTEFDYAGEKRKWDQRNNNVYGRTSRSDRPFDYYGFRAAYHVSYGEPGSPPRFPLTDTEAGKTQLWWVKRSYQPWVVEHTEGPKAVSIDVTENIVKWNGELPDAD